MMLSNETLWEGMTECDEHPANEEDCEKCEAERKEITKRLTSLQQSVQDRVNGIATNPSPAAQQAIATFDGFKLAVQVDVMKEFMFNNNPRMAALFEGECMTRLLQGVKNMQEATKQPTLHIARGPMDLSKMKG